jgi:hypothetical protein
MAKKSDDNVEIPGRAYNTDDVKAMKEEGRRGRGRRWGLMALVTIVLIPALLFGLWSAIALGYSYSEGDRIGYVPKFSKKGWICKTWEGEMLIGAPGSMTQPEVFAFTVRDDKVAEELERIRQGGAAQISVTYEQKKGVPTSCFGDTQYFVTAVRAVSMPGAAPGTTVPAAPGGTTPPPQATTPTPGATPAPAPATPTPTPARP